MSNITRLKLASEEIILLFGITLENVLTINNSKFNEYVYHCTLNKR